MTKDSIGAVLSYIEKSTTHYPHLQQLKQYQDWHDMDSKTQLNCYMELFELFYEQHHLHEALYYFSVSKTLITHYGETEEYRKFLYNTVKKAVFTQVLPDTKYIVENIVPKFVKERNYELLSLCYLILSHIHINERRLLMAIEEAKMASHFAKKAEPNVKYSLLCEAQLQLMRLAIELQIDTQLDSSLVKFEWHLDVCKAANEVFFITAMHAALQMLDGAIEQAIETYEQVLPILRNDTQIAPALQLSKQLLTALQHMQSHIDPQTFERLQQQCIEIIGDYQLSFGQSSGLSTYLTILNVHTGLENRLVTPLNFFKQGQLFYERALQSDKNVVCIVVNVNLLQLSHEEKLIYTEQFQSLERYVQEEDYFICQFEPHILTVVTIVNDKQLDLFFDLFLKDAAENNPYFVLLDPVDSGGIENFHQLFNYTHYTWSLTKHPFLQK